MQKFTDMHECVICDGANIYFNGDFPCEVPPTNQIRNGIAIIEGDKLIFAAYINNQLQGIGLYWDFDNEPCYDLIVSKEEVLPTIIKYRGITAEIFKGSNGFECKVIDRIGNVIRWLVYADSMPHAIAKAERHFDGAIACLRGFTTTSEFFDRMYGGSL